MAEARRDLKELDCANLSADWKNWKRDFLVYMIANGKNTQPETKKIATFLWLIGTKGANIYNTLFPNDGSEQSLLGTMRVSRSIPARDGTPAHEVEEIRQRTLNEVLEKFDEHCLPQKNVTMESYKFNNLVQKERQTFGEFLTELRTQIERCEYNCTCGVVYEERMLRDRIITGVFDKKLQLKLLDGRNEKLDRVVDLCKTFESANLNKGILDSKKSSVAAIASEIKSSEKESSEQNAVDAVYKRFCFNCGGEWNFEHKSKCPAKEYKCKCGKIGHFNRMCRKKKNTEDTTKSESSSRGQQNKPRINYLDWNDGKSIILGDKLSCTLSCNNFIYRINSIGLNNEKWTKAYQLGDKVVKFKIDTGADVNCVPLKIIRDLKIKMSCERNDLSVFDYSNNKIKIFGMAELRLFDLKNKTERLANFLVVDNTFEPILGRMTCFEFGLIKRLDIDSVTLPGSKEEFVARNADVFTGIGKCPGNVTIHLREDSRPVLHYRKRFPFTIVEKLKIKLNELVQDGIISPVEYPTDWVNNLQLVEKDNGDLRICLDPKPLNACIRREHFLIPTIDDFTSKLSNKKIFTVLDLKNGFWHMELDGKSSDLTTFIW